MGRRAPPFVDLADDLLEQVFDRDETGHAAVLIHHHRHLRAVTPHGGEHFVELGRAGNGSALASRAATGWFDTR